MRPLRSDWWNGIIHHIASIAAFILYLCHVIVWNTTMLLLPPLNNYLNLRVEFSHAFAHDNEMRAATISKSKPWHMTSMKSPPKQFHCNKAYRIRDMRNGLVKWLVTRFFLLFFPILLLVIQERWRGDTAPSFHSNDVIFDVSNCINFMNKLISFRYARDIETFCQCIHKRYSRYASTIFETRTKYTIQGT